MRRTPNKREALAILENVDSRIAAIITDVRWAANLGVSPKVRPVEQVSKSGEGDSTGQTVLTQELTRAQVKKVYAWVGKLDEVLDRIDSELKYLFEKADHRKDYEADPLTGEHGRHPNMGPLVTKGDLERARSAKARRDLRGEGFGVS